MSKLPRWKRKLSKKDIAHLNEMGDTSLAKFKATIAHQAELRRLHSFSVCRECDLIARKIGLFGDENA